MNLSQAYLRWREDSLREGRQEGIQEDTLEERRDLIENSLIVRFGALDEQLLGLIPVLLKFPPAELTHVLITLSREELLQRFGR